MNRRIAATFLAWSVVLPLVGIATAQQSVVNTYLDAARKAQDNREKAKLFRMALKEAEGTGNQKLLAQVQLANGSFEEAQGNYPEAERLMKRAISLPNDPSFTAHANSLLGNLYRYSGRSAEALPYYRKAVALREANQPRTSWELAQSMRDLADCLREMSKLDEAEPIYRQAISILERQSDRKYHLSYALSGLAELRLAQNDVAAAEPLARQALSILEGLDNPIHFNMGICYSTLAQIKEKEGLNDEALVLYLKSIEEFSETPILIRSLRFVPSLESAARLLRKTGKPDEAADLEKRASEIKKVRSVGKIDKNSAAKKGNNQRKE